MWIKASVILSCLITVSLAVDEHRPKKREDRGKRQLEYAISHRYQGPHAFRAERRISGPPFTYLNPPNLPGPSRYSTINKDDLAGEHNHIHEHYGHPPEHHYRINLPKIIERPVFIKEPEPIIEIIIKESNVTLPPLPTTPPPKKKKEEVQVFYVKYKKNPNGYGKDSVIYDKPIPAISPQLPDQEHEEEEEHPGYPAAQETITHPPPPSTTLRTLIKPDSELYHSESGIKVTFGKEGWDHSKRSNKPEELNQQERSSTSDQPHSVQFPQARQLSNFPTYQKRTPSFAPTFDSNKGFRSDRPPQGYRPFNAPPPPQFKQSQPQFNRPPPQFSPPSQFKFQNPPYVKPPTQTFSTPPFLRQVAPQLSFPPNNAPFPPFSSPPQRQPVPYKPFDQIRPQQPPTQHFNNPPQQFRQPPSFRPSQNIQFRPETHFPVQQHPPLPLQNHVFNPQNLQEQKIQQLIIDETKNRRPIEQNHQIQQQNHHIQQQNHQNHQQNQQTQQQNHQNQQQNHQIQQQQLQHQQLQQQLQQHQQLQQQQQLQQNQLIQQQNEHLQNFEHNKNLVPPGGELIHSLPKYEQHYSVIENGKPQQNLPPLQKQESQQISLQQNNINLQQQSSFNSQQSNYNQPQQQRFENPQPKPQQFVEDKQQQTFYQQLLQQQYQQQQAFTTPRSTTVYRTTTSAPRYVYQTTTSPKQTTTTTEEPSTPSTTTKDPRILEAQLPDEVPEDLRAQLLSSGILNNADISILDYDKVGDIPLSALPPDQLANFYNAGGGSQIGAESQQVESVLKPSGEDLDSAGSEFQPVKLKAPLQMKVVHYNPETGDGQQVQSKYLKQGAKRVDPVVLNDSTYNRYLPLKVNGTQFPIPDVPELKGKKISSVVVLAPVAYDFSAKRKTRKIDNAEELALVQDDSLKVLLNNPTSENYRKFLENESKTRPDKQSVILLVTRGAEGKEIFMYDIPTKSVSKLSGELSSAFVDAAEANAEKDDAEAAASNIVETRIPFEGQIDRNDSFEETDLEGAGSEVVGSNIPIIDPMKDDLEPEASEQLSSFVDFSRKALSKEDMSVSSELKFDDGLRL